MSEFNRTAKLYEHVEEYKKSLSDLLAKVDMCVLEQIIDQFIRVQKTRNTIYVCGNGGSAATASHFQVDFGFFVRYFTEKRIKIKSLTDQVPMITAIGNDHSYEDIFIDQMIDNFNPGDVLIAISASGNSANLLKAVDYANNNGGTSIAFVGFDGGKLKNMANIVMFTPNPPKQYGPIEDLHMILDHMMVSYLAKDEEFLSIK
ncbi:MAG: SIS domain-containing protein [Melioribacteraceae bacterium]|nr:SIS domain-containing protein [Melioribacteraceae bacterium]MCF8263490.1 SIS domain-containing protein [Melioribacteraceae bacterium]MCF8296956.1 SIS domain-containing protein [Saprospiraceae bacterium]